MRHDDSEGLNAVTRPVEVHQRTSGRPGIAGEGRSTVVR